MLAWTILLANCSFDIVVVEAEVDQCYLNAAKNGQVHVIFSANVEGDSFRDNRSRFLCPVDAKRLRPTRVRQRLVHQQVPFPGCVGLSMRDEMYRQRNITMLRVKSCTS